jgi:hypothetical protein
VDVENDLPFRQVGAELLHHSGQMPSLAANRGCLRPLSALRYRSGSRAVPPLPGRSLRSKVEGLLGDAEKDPALIGEGNLSLPVWHAPRETRQEIAFHLVQSPRAGHGGFPGLLYTTGGTGSSECR